MSCGGCGQSSSLCGQDTELSVSLNVIKRCLDKVHVCD